MTRARLRVWFALFMCALVLCMVGGSFWLAGANDYDRWSVSFLLGVATWAVLAPLIISHQPANPVGWSLLGGSFFFSLGEFSRQYALYGLLTAPGSLPLARLMASPPYWAWFPGIICLFVLLPLYFPTGRLLSPRWRPLLGLTAASAVLVTLLGAIRPGDTETQGIPNPLASLVVSAVPQWPALSAGLDFIMLSWLMLAFAAAASVVIRFRRARGAEREQMKWFTYAAVLPIVLTLLEHTALLHDLPAVVSALVGLATLQTVPLAIAIAILRYRLYDIDLIIRRTLIYALLTAALLGAYFGTVILLQSLFQSLTNQSYSELITALSTLTIAALFTPLRRRVQAFIDRRFYRRKYDAARTLEAFGATVRNEVELDVLAAVLLGTVQETVQPASVSLWLQKEA